MARRWCLREPLSMAWSRPAARALAERGFQVLNFDYGPPSGWTSEPIARSALDQVTDVVDVMAAADFNRAHLVGMSRGAMTAFGLASRHPARVDRLVLVAPVAGFADTIHIGDSGDQSEDSGASAEEMLDRVVESAFSTEFLNRGLAEARALFTSPPGTVVRLDRSEGEPFGDDESVSKPTLVIECDSDQVVTHEHPSEYASVIDDAEYVVVPDGSHSWLYEQPDAFADVVAPFLTKPDAG